MNSLRLRIPSQFFKMTFDSFFNALDGFLSFREATHNGLQTIQGSENLPDVTRTAVVSGGAEGVCVIWGSSIWEEANPWMPNPQ